MAENPAPDEQISFRFEPDASAPLTFQQTVLLSLDTIFERADQGMLRILREDKRIERKPASILKSHELADYFSMWANTGPDGGLIAVGIANDGKALGCLSIEIEHISKLESDAHNQCPDARFQCRRVPILRDRDGAPDFVLLFRVHFHPTRVVFTSRHQAFNRLGEKKHLLSHDEIRDLQHEKREVSVELEPCPQYTFPDDFDAELVADYVAAVHRNMNLTVPQSDEAILANTHLGAFKDGRFVPNAACVLVFARDPRLSFSGAKIQMLRFEGEHEGVGAGWNAVKEGWSQGPIPRLLKTAETFLDGQLRDFSRLGPDGRFYSAPEYPRDAWYEAILNALVHRSYGSLKAMTVKVKMFDDRLEIESPGPFPAGVTAENIYQTISHPRNHFIMDAMWFLRFVKQCAEGTKRMLKLMTESALPPPEFKETEVGHAVVRVVLRNNIKVRKRLIDSSLAASIISPEVYGELSENERLVLNHVAQYKTINTSQAVRITEKGWKSAHKLLLRLVALGILKHHHNNKEKDPHAHFTLAAGNGAGSTAKG